MLESAGLSVTLQQQPLFLRWADAGGPEYCRNINGWEALAHDEHDLVATWSDLPDLPTLLSRLQRGRGGRPCRDSATTRVLHQPRGGRPVALSHLSLAD